ncbi:Carbon monoxide dehydrogenase subunit G [Saccharopolyspora shandongensis]|uniref:Carbon monoxide dehydrogenase subunit G n=1 Tax=Saccharopolyspora shandongensis TaxID=418495 RepID=A0A1H3T9T3_9PSEU|nr:SRPBCC family protein [Saccharopolyspora shandongensis]SDZ46996.1 Carbon monoxide dehydrogenase subunit G [Saccharopolyspora shandongensis]
MKLQHQTEVGASAEDVWTFLQDTRAVAQCLPGAELVNELGDDRYEGVLRVAIGPLKMNYAGDVLVVERDAEAHRMALNATGRDKRGSGAVQANVRLQVTSADAGSRIEVVSDVDLSGRIASLGRGVRDVSNRMFVQFADQLSNRIEHPEPDTGATAPAPTPLPSGRSAGTMPATTTAPARQAPAGDAQKAGEIKVLSLVWTVTRERFADFLEKLSIRVRPR